MRGVLSVEAGPPNTLTERDVPAPVAQEGEILIRIRACGINYPDVLIIEDKYQVRPPRPFIPGGEISGEVIAIGTGATGFSVGDRVLGITSHGGLAEQIALPAAKCVRIPDEIPWDIAAGLVFTYGTAIHALHDRAALKAGETLLVLGAAGGVGLAAVQLGKAAGATVIAAVSSEAKAAAAKAAGADLTVIYPSGPLDRDSAKAMGEQVKAATGKRGADVICDTVGGDYAEPALRSIALNGRFLVIGFPNGIPKIPANLILLKECQIVGVFWGAFSAREPDKDRVNIEKLFDLWKAGAIKPHISAHYPLAEAGCAIADLGERRAIGKVVVEIA